MNLVQTFKRIVPRSLWPYMRAIRGSARTSPARAYFQKRQLLADPTLTQGDRDLLTKVSSRIYFDDSMYDGNGAHYFKVGLSAIQVIDKALENAGLREVRSILDLPCGSGRVLRFLAQRFPSAKITACEIERGPVRFCARTFGAEPAYSSVNFDELSLDKSFDVIWCGSLITHLNEHDIRALLRFFRRHLPPGGLMVFTTHGDYVAEKIPRRDFNYMLGEEQFGKVSANYSESGYFFEEYPETKNWGTSLTSPQWIRAQVSELGGLREVFFQERGWDNHHDVFGFVREGQ